MPNPSLYYFYQCIKDKILHKRKFSVDEDNLPNVSNSIMSFLKMDPEVLKRGRYSIDNYFDKFPIKIRLFTY